MGLFACLQVCVCVCERERERVRVEVCEKKSDTTARRAIHLFFLVEALSVTVGYAEASRIEHVADFKTAQDALHLPPTRPLGTRQKNPDNTNITH